MGILADRSPNRIPIGDTQLGVGRKAAGSPTKVAMERMIAARDEERRKDQELRKLVLDVEADGESLRLAQADYDAALSRQKRATDEYEAAHEEKRKRVRCSFSSHGALGLCRIDRWQGELDAFE